MATCQSLAVCFLVIHIVSLSWSLVRVLACSALDQCASLSLIDAGGSIKPAKFFLIFFLSFPSFFLCRNSFPYLIQRRGQGCWSHSCRQYSVHLWSLKKRSGASQLFARTAWCVLYWFLTGSQLHSKEQVVPQLGHLRSCQIPDHILSTSKDLYHAVHC